MFGVKIEPTGLAVGTHRFHYGWVIVGVASMMWTTSSAIRFAASLLVPDFESNFGWSYGLIAAGFTIQWIVSGLLGPVVGWMGDRYGVRKIMFAGAIMFIAGMLLTGIMTHIWMFWLFFGVILAAAMAVFQVTLVSGVTIWFKSKLGLAMGTLQGLQGIGTALMILIVFVLFTAWGLRGAFWGPGIVGGAILLLGIRYFHNEPAAIGLRPYGASESEPIRRLQDNPEAKVRSSVFLKKAQGTTSFWNLIGIHFWGCAGHNVILIFLVAIAEDDSIGLSRAMSVAIYVTLMVVSTITRFAVPVAADRMGSKGVMGASFVLQTFPLLLLLFAVQVYPEAWLFFVFAILFGIGMGGEMTAFPIINRQYYGDAPIGATYGFQMMGAGIGMALGPLAGGILWDMTDAIWPMLILSFALSLVGVVSIFALPNTSQQVIPDWEESLPEGAQVSAGS
jgi:MFS family permease